MSKKTHNKKWQLTTRQQQHAWALDASTAVDDARRRRRHLTPVCAWMSVCAPPAGNAVAHIRSAGVTNLRPFLCASEG
ncbi:hypothetical protein TSMEX_010236 [Taenia solium]|eukprot:TsM_000904300 transcript=TsM_000904300 gene=TsM_000904300